MAEQLVDVDLDALAPSPKKMRLGGKVWKLPGDMPMELYFRLQSFDEQIKAGADETGLLASLRDELLELMQVHQPTLKELPAGIGLRTLIGALPAIYSGATEGEGTPNRATRRSKKKTTSAKPRARARAATSR